MSGYLARLALRALGRPVDASITPRRDARAAFARDLDRADEIGGEQETQARVPLPREADPRQPAAAAVPAASVRRAPSAEAAPGQASPRAPGVGAHSPSTSEHAPFTPAAVEPALDASRVALGVRASRAAAPASEPLASTPAAACANASFLDLHDTHADPVAPRGPIARAQRPGGQVGQAESPARDRSPRSTATPANALGERRAAIETPAGPRSATPSAVPGEASARRDAPAISVEIGRIEVKVAPPPAPVARPRAAPEDFDRYWRLRNYLERPR